MGPVPTDRMGRALHIDGSARHLVAEVGNQWRVLIDIAKIEMVLLRGLIVKPAHLFLIQVDVGYVARNLGDFDRLSGLTVRNVDGRSRTKGSRVSRLIGKGSLVDQLFGSGIPGKCALQLCQSRCIRKERARAGVAGCALESSHPVRAPEKEKLVLQDGAAQRAAVSILSKGRDVGMSATARRALPRGTVAKLRSLLSLGKRRKPRPGVELKARSMELVRATPGDVVDDASRIASILRAEVVGDHLDLLQRILV